MRKPIDKVTFLASLDCLSKGWHVFHDEGGPLSRGLAWRFYGGNDIARRAREWLGAGRMVRRTPVPNALESTRELLASPETSLLFEASFAWGGCSARADALRRCDSGWELIEIKAGLAPAPGEAVKDEYLLDISYTAFVAESAGLRVAAAKLVLVNRDYRLNGSAAMFVEVDVTEAVREKTPLYRERANDIVAAASRREKPTPRLEFICKDCDYFATDCIGAGIDDPLFHIPRLSQKKFDQLRQHERISRLPLNVDLTANQLRVVRVIQSGEEHIDRSGLVALDKIAYPVHYLDFETVNPYLPWFADRPPYDMTVFQYSLHLRTTPGGDCEHRSYLAPVDGDWRRELIGRLLGDLGNAGSIVVYSPFEKTHLNALKAIFPDLAASIGAVVERLVDLEKVVKEAYTHPKFGGRTSIKKVLPVVAPDLGYGDLPIFNGDEALASFALMRVGEIPREEHARVRAALEEYCRLDTEAMVRVHDFLDGLRGK